MGIHHLLTYNISIQYVLVIHVHVTYRVCTSEVKTDKETKNHPLPLLRRNSNIRDASFVYGTHSHGGQVYVCSHYPSCNSYVGVHPGTKIPKGTLANRELRQKRIQAHRIFDQIWQQGILSKPEAYRWVADKFCLTDKQAHIGQFSNYMCDQLIRESADVLKNNHIPFRLRAAS